MRPHRSHTDPCTTTPERCGFVAGGGGGRSPNRAAIRTSQSHTGLTIRGLRRQILQRLANQPLDQRELTLGQPRILLACAGRDAE